MDTLRAWLLRRCGAMACYWHLSDWTGGTPTRSKLCLRHLLLALRLLQYFRAESVVAIREEGPMERLLGGGACLHHPQFDSEVAVGLADLCVNAGPFVTLTRLRVR